MSVESVEEFSNAYFINLLNFTSSFKNGDHEGRQVSLVIDP